MLHEFLIFLVSDLCPAHPILHFITVITFGGVQIMKVVTNRVCGMAHTFCVR
jgi:hypothetical protein